MNSKKLVLLSELLRKYIHKPYPFSAGAIYIVLAVSYLQVIRRGIKSAVRLVGGK